MNRGMSVYAVKRRAKPPAETTPAEAAGAAFAAEAGGLLSVDGIEVTQVVQDMSHSVPLIAGKVTVVRVYLSRPEGEAVMVRGEISVRRGQTGTPHLVPSLDTARVSPTQNGRLRTKRHDFRLSLNFRLPAELTAAGRVIIGVSSLADAGTGKALDCSDCAERRVEVSFFAGAPLRVRLIR